MNPYDDAFLATVMDQLIDAVCVVDIQGRFVFVSAAGERIFGYPIAELIGRRMIELVHPDDRSRTLDAVVEIVAGTHKPNFENRYLRKDGSVVHIMWTARWSASGQVRIAMARDVSERKRTEALNAALYAVSEAAHGSDELVDLFAQIHHIVQALLPAPSFFVALLDQARLKLEFAYHRDAFGHPPPPPQALHENVLSARVVRSGEALLLTPQDRAGDTSAGASDVGRHTVDWLGVPLKGSKGTIGALVLQNHPGERRYQRDDLELLQFVSAQIATAIERKQWQALLRHAALHDPLTGLPNRTLLHERLRKALEGPRNEGACLAVLYVDLDRFKQVNDRLGHTAGDLLLQETARRLKACLREGDTVARMGGDEFVILLDDMRLACHAAAVAEKILAALTEPYTLEGQSAEIAPSIGWAVSPDHGNDYQKLIRLADHAMYAAKRAGGRRAYGA